MIFIWDFNNGDTSSRTHFLLIFDDYQLLVQMKCLKCILSALIKNCVIHNFSEPDSEKFLNEQKWAQFLMMKLLEFYIWPHLTFTMNVIVTWTNSEQLQVILSERDSIYVRNDILSLSTPIQITDNNSDNSIHGQKSADDLKSSSICHISH